MKLTTDSQYVKQNRDGCRALASQWLRTADRKPVKNQDLWERLVAAAAPHRIAWHWTRGHSGHAENELVDQHARLAAERTAKG